MLNEGVRTLIGTNTKKILDKLTEIVNDDKNQKSEDGASVAKWRQDLDKSMKKTLFDSFKEMSTIMKSIESNLKKVEKNHADDKKQLTSLTKKINEDLNKFDKKSLKTIDELFEKIENNHTEVLTQNFFETFVLHFDKKMKELQSKYSEIKTQGFIY